MIRGNPIGQLRGFKTTTVRLGCRKEVQKVKHDARGRRNKKVVSLPFTLHALAAALGVQPTQPRLAIKDAE